MPPPARGACLKAGGGPMSIYELFNRSQHRCRESPQA